MVNLFHDLGCCNILIFLINIDISTISKLMICDILHIKSIKNIKLENKNIDDLATLSHLQFQAEETKNI